MPPYWNNFCNSSGAGASSLRTQQPASQHAHNTHGTFALTSDEQILVEELFADYSRGVGSFVLARVGDAELAEELVSRVFVAAAGAIGQCRGAPAAWLWTIVRNELAMHFRGLRRASEDPRGLDRLAAPFEDQAERAEAHDQMSRALRRLPEELQQIVWMRFYQDMSNTSIAEATGLKPGHVGVLVHRALKQLRAWMAEPRAVTALDGAPLKTNLRTAVKEDVR